MVEKLNADERATSLKTLLEDGWKMVVERDAIKKTFMFKNFTQAWSWMNGVALESEKGDHHPEWFNVYNKVEVTWSTHEANGLTVRDVKMATFCDSSYKNFSQF